MKTALVTDSLFFNHETGPGHPERAARLRAVLDALQDLDLVRIPARDATYDEIARAHDPAHAPHIAGQLRDGARQLDNDTVVGPGSLEAALRAAGAALALGEAWLEGHVDNGFAAVRPPGHHATPSRAMGFCLFNNVAILARMLAAAGRRVAIFDWDVHHGNGTQDIFFNDASVGYASVHQAPLYPGTGRATEVGAGNILNRPLPAGTRGDAYVALVQDEIIPWLEERAPDVVLISAGFDAHTRDPLGGMEVEAEHFAQMTKDLMRWPCLSVLEGGYDLDGLAESARAHVMALTAGA